MPYKPFALSEKWGIFQGSAHMSTGHAHIFHGPSVTMEPHCALCAAKKSNILRYAIESPLDFLHLEAQ